MWEEAAKTLGAKWLAIFWRVTLPNISWGLLYGVHFDQRQSDGEFGAVSVVWQHCPQTQTLPLFVEEAYKQYQTQAAFSAAVLAGSISHAGIEEILERKLASKMLNRSWIW